VNRGRALAVLSSGFHGRLSATTDWMELLEAANSALVTPSLYRALEAAGVAGEIPEDAAAFIAMIGLRNDERNLQLRALAFDAVEALNAVEVIPTYLKGMAVWASCDPAADRYPRMMSDVDLLVRPEQAERGIEGLLARGFRLLKRYDPNEHVVAELFRDGDVGILDLHQRPPGPRDMAERVGHDGQTQAAWPGSARLPSATHQIYLTCLHDMFHDGGFWRGGFDVRHLCDIADLVRGPGAVAWEAFEGLLQPRLVRNAVFSQLVAAHRIAGAPIPQDILRRVVPRLHHRRHRAQYLHPDFGFPLALLGIGLEGFNLPRYWPHLGADGMTVKTLLWWLHRGRAYPNKL